VRPEEIISSRNWEKPFRVGPVNGRMDRTVLSLATDRLGYEPMALMTPTPWPYASMTTIYLGMFSRGSPWLDIRQLAISVGRDLWFSDEGILVME
jgi:hypothetical protein